MTPCRPQAPGFSCGEDVNIAKLQRHGHRDEGAKIDHVRKMLGI